MLALFPYERISLGTVPMGIYIIAHPYHVVPQLYHTIYPQRPSITTIKLFLVKQKKRSELLKFQAF